MLHSSQWVPYHEFLLTNEVLSEVIPIIIAIMIILHGLRSYIAALWGKILR